MRLLTNNQINELNLFDHRSVFLNIHFSICPSCHFPSTVTGLRAEQELVTSYPQVVMVRVPTPWVQSDSDITVLRHLEKMGCRLINRPQAILNCVNKFWTFQELAGHGVPLPDTFSYGKSVLDCAIFTHEHH